MMWKALLDILLPNPSMCVLCEKRLAQLGICDECLARWQKIAEHEGQCQRCGQFGTRAAVCDTCRQWPAYFLGNTALLPYDGTVSDAIRRLKYAGEPWRAEGFASLFAARSAPDVDMVIPVPLHKRRLRERGYNQSLLLAEQLVRVWQLPLYAEGLVRTVNTKHQVGFSRAERMRNVAGAFAVPQDKRAALAGKRVLLVDDVMTTGSTLLACARALHEGGVKNVESITLAAVIH